MKRHLYERFKIDAEGTSQGRHPKDVFWDALSTSAGHFSKTVGINIT